MSRLVVPSRVSRRNILKLGGAAAVAGALPGARRVSAQTAKSAVVYGRVPYTNWSGIRFWTNSGVPSRLLFEPLFDIDDSLMPTPALAESWEVVSNTLIRIKLRSGVAWSDGTPLTADDVVFSMNLTFNKDVNAQTATEIATVAGGAEVRAGTATSLTGVRAVDAQTVEIETAIPDSTILRTLALRWWSPIPKHVYDSVAPVDLLASPQMLQPPVVSGPFKIDRVEPDMWYEMSANASYWRGKPKLDAITFVYGGIGDPVAQASQDQFQFAVFQNMPDIAAAIAENPNYTVTSVDYIQPYRLQFNCSLPQFSDPKFRKAVAYAIDRDTLTQQIYRGNATVQTSDFQGDLLDPTAEVYSYDPDKARALLAEIGWDTSQTVYFERQAAAAGTTADPIVEAENAAYTQWLGDVGIKLEIRLHADSATYNNFVIPAAPNPEFHLYENPHRRYDMYGALEMKNYLKSEPGNLAYWKNADADALIDQAVATTDAEEYANIGKQLSVLVADQVPYIPTKAVKIAIVAHKSFSGYSTLGEYYYAYARPYDWDVTV
jgi:peptide/nickel transport system substrate-binding protein